jgi:hypothetical protein
MNRPEAGAKQTTETSRRHRPPNAHGSRRTRAGEVTRKDAHIDTTLSAATERVSCGPCHSRIPPGAQPSKRTGRVEINAGTHRRHGRRLCPGARLVLVSARGDHPGGSREKRGSRVTDADKGRESKN